MVEILVEAPGYGDISFQRIISYAEKFKVNDQKLVRCLTHIQGIKEQQSGK